MTHAALSLFFAFAIMGAAHAQDGKTINKIISFEKRKWKISFDPAFKNELAKGKEIKGPYVTGADGMRGMKCNYVIHTGNNIGVGFSCIPLSGAGCIDIHKIAKVIRLVEKGSRKRPEK